MKTSLNRIFFVAFLCGSTVYAATTANLTLTGAISTVIDIVVTPNGAGNSLNLTATQSDLVVASASESSNGTNGYRIKARSLNNGTIKSTVSAANVAYQIKYGGGGLVSLTTSDTIVKTQSTFAIYTGVASDVSISYTGVSNLVGGNYSDTITFTIEAL